MVKYTDIKAWRFVRTSGNGVHEGSSHAEDRICHMARAEDTKLCKKHGDIQTATFRQGMWLKATDAAAAVTVFVVHDCKENQSCKAPSLPKCSKREGDTAPVAKSENQFYIIILHFMTVLTAELKLDNRFCCVAVFLNVNNSILLMSKELNWKSCSTLMAFTHFGYKLFS